MKNSMRNVVKEARKINWKVFKFEDGVAIVGNDSLVVMTDEGDETFEIKKSLPTMLREKAEVFADTLIGNVLSELLFQPTLADKFNV